MSRNPRIGVLVAALGFSLYAVGAQAADKARPHRQGLAQSQQQHPQAGKPCDARGAAGVDCTMASAWEGYEITPLTKAVPATGVFAPQYDVSFYSLDVPPGQVSLTFALSGGTGAGDADLGVKYGSLPDESLSDLDGFSSMSGNNELVSFDNPAAGTWYVAVIGYEEESDLVLVGDYTDVVPPTCGSNTVLSNGVPVGGIHGSTANCEVRFTLEVPAHSTNLSFVMSGGSGDADLYVKFGSAPTTGSYDCRPFSDNNDETCEFPTAQAGTYHAMIRRATNFADVGLVASYTEGDFTVPTISAEVERMPNSAGWYNKKVTVSWTCEDVGSGIPEGGCPAPKVYNANTAVNGVLTPAYRIRDIDGNLSAPSNQFLIKLDRTNPTIEAQLDSEPNGFGWYTGDVTVAYACADALSGIASCPVPTVITKRGAGIKLPKGSAVDEAGNKTGADVGTINIDSTGPTIIDVEFSGPLVVGAEVTASLVAADAQSGIASSSCGAVDTSKAKKYGVTCTATNGAGLEKSKKFYYTVEAAPTVK